MATSTKLYQIICITETSLQLHIYNEELFHSGYTVYRRDRNLETGLKKDGSDVLIVAEGSLKSGAVEKWCTRNSVCDDLWVTIDLGDKFMHICCGYCPPYASANNLLEHLNNLNDFVSSKPNDLFCIVGGYNLPRIDWVFDSDGRYLYPSN